MSEQTESTAKEKPSFFLRAAKQLYTVGGLGLLPKAPGTWGTLMGIPIYFLLKLPGHWTYYLGGAFLVFLVGWWASAVGEKDYGRHDDQRIVIDEVFGYLVAMFPSPFPLPWWGFVWGFVIFRFFDIFKFGPAKWADKNVPGGLGVMVDDGAAGLMSWAVLLMLGLGYKLFFT
ncbi:MAG: phosphatidylglycerophosphatase A [Deltaproteobacteria bacterium]|jgi:phosphatidylglycerophosphatase A|nr:phosphatidylglycerophosphatase A [Deltaproteobacteria bacterium]